MARAATEPDRADVAIPRLPARRLVVDSGVVVAFQSMSPGRHVRHALTVSLLCGCARVAFADGVIPSEETMNELVALAVFGTIVVLVVVFLIIRPLDRGIRNLEAKVAQPARPALPAARVVRDRDIA